jgi:hypothetical protein
MMVDMTDPMVTLRGVVEASPDAVAAIVLDARPGGRSPLATTGTATPADGDTFTVAHDGGKIFVEVDRAARTIALQGQWWYRGETTVTAHERGSLVTYRVINVARSGRWGVRFVARGPLAAAPAAFAGSLAALGETLGCPAYPLG